MIALIIAPFYIALNIYAIKRFAKWLCNVSYLFEDEIARNVVYVCYGIFMATPVVAYLLPHSYAKKIITRVANYYMGAEVYIICAVAMVLLYKKIEKRNVSRKVKNYRRINKRIGLAALTFIISVTFYGAINARIVRHTPYSVSINKNCGHLKKLNISLVADIHLGYSIGVSQVKQMVSVINSGKPDIVLIAGDVFDNDYDSIENPDEIVEILSRIKSKYGVYATYGNHDIKESILCGFTFGQKVKESDSRMDQLLANAGIKLLRDETMLIDNSFYLVSRPDYSKPGRGIKKRKNPKQVVDGLDKSKPIILFEHQPIEQEELSRAGVDLDLNGHTHAGQMLPNSLLVNLKWSNAYGYKSYGKMHNIVTSGVGIFGPFMRVGTKAEVASIRVDFVSTTIENR